MEVAIYSRGIEGGQKGFLQELIQALANRRIDIYLHHNLAAGVADHNPQAQTWQFFEHLGELPAQPLCLISLGGDGTILDSALLVRGTDIPILGINFGRLGFLSSLGISEMESAVEAMVQGSYIIDQRTMLQLDASAPIFREPYALNEFVLHKQDLKSMLKIHTYINGEFLNTYWCDGLILSTPTGSTAYNLSCNGPILYPDCGSFALTPISPHHLNVRPLVVPDSNIISFEVEGRSDQFICSLDARSTLVPIKTQIAVRRHEKTIGLVRIAENTFLTTLRTKLNWGQDVRN